MARMIPAVIDSTTRSQGESLLFERLRDDPSTADWIVLHSLDIATHRKSVSGEADFVALVPGKGVLCIEVKASHSVSRSDDGLWHIGKQNPDSRGPFKQASEAMHSLRAYVAKESPRLRGILFWSAVVFTHTNFRIASPEWHDWQVVDAASMRRRPIGVTLGAVLDHARAFVADRTWFDPNEESPNEADVQTLLQTLRPRFEFYESPKQRRRRTEEELKIYSDEQTEALDEMSENDRVIFQGPAGTGKTLLATEAARRGASVGESVLFLCFNRLLAKKLREELVAEGSRTIDCVTMSRFMLDLAGASPVGKSPQFWKDELPGLALDALLVTEDPLQRYDLLVVDEAQDLLTEQCLDVMDLVLVGGLAGGRWRFFGDFEKQAIYQSEGADIRSFRAQRAPDASVVSLRTNCRNTPRVAALAGLLGGLLPDYKRVRRPDDEREPELRYFSTQEDQLDLLSTALDQAYADGYRASEIVVLSPRADRPLASILDEDPWQSRLVPLADVGSGKVGYCTIHAFKGLESPVVIVTDIDAIGDEHSQALFYVAVTRALERLVFFIDERQKRSIVTTLMPNPGEAKSA